MPFIDISGMYYWIIIWYYFAGCLCPTLLNGYTEDCPESETDAVGSTVYYHCNNGYTLFGSSFDICQTNGNWSTSKPSCQKGEYTTLAIIRILLVMIFQIIGDWIQIKIETIIWYSQKIASKKILQQY